MTTSTRSLDFHADQHVYLLPHVSKDVFQIRTCATIKARWQMLSPELYNLEAGTALLFNSSPGPGSQKAALFLRKLAAPHKVNDSALEGSWYALSCCRALIDAATENLEWASIIPLRVVVPKDPVERADQEEEEAEYRRARQAVERAEALDRRQKAKAVIEADNELQRHADAKARTAKEDAEREATRQRLLAGDFFAPGHAPANLLEQLTSKLTKFNVLCNGFCELRRISHEKFELNYYVRAEVAHQVSCLVWDLQDVFVVGGIAEGDTSPRLNRPFKGERPAFPPAKSRTISHRSVSIHVDEAFFLDVLLELKPGIRGWDLAANSPVLGYHPPDSANLGRPTPPVACPVRKVWSTGRSCKAPEIQQYLQKFGIKLGWEPPKLRFVATSPFPQDAGAPLMLLRLERDSEAVGVQKIRLDTGERETLSFKGCSAENAVGALWVTKPHVFLVSCLEDAMAMQSRVRKPCIVAPSPQALAEFVWSAELECVTALLPATNPEPWMEAVAALMARKDVPGISIKVAQVFPNELSDCPGFPYPAEWAWQCSQPEIKVGFRKRK